jgi:O-antigen ligase
MDRTSIVTRAVDQVEGLLWMVLLAGAPLIVVPGAYEPYFLPKTLWVECLIVLLACLRLVLLLLGRPLRLEVSAAPAALVVFALWHAVSILWAQSPSLAGDQARFWLLAALAGLLFPSAFAQRPGRLAALGLALLASAGATAVWALSDDLRAVFWPETARVGDRLGDWRGRIAAGLGNTGHIADFLAMAYPLAFVVFLRAKKSWSRSLGLALLWLVYAALIVCFSVHSNIGLVVAMLLTLWWLWRRHGWAWFRARTGRIALLAAGWLAIALFFSLDLPGNPRRPGVFRQAFASERLAFGWPSRVFIWETSLEIVNQNRWLGVGSGNFEFAFPSTHSPLVLADPDLQWMAGSWTNAAHNSLLQAWAELGILGPAILLALFLLAFRSLGGAPRRGEDFEAHARIAALAALTALAVHAQMNFPLQMAPASLWLVMIAALAAVLEPRPEEGVGLPDLCLDYDWGRVGVEQATFGRPAAIRIEPRPAPLLALSVAALLCLPLCLWQFHGATRKQAADVAYRSAALTRDYAKSLARPSGGLSPEADQAFRQADARFQQALELWPDHHDCRSAYSDMLVVWGRGEEALEQVDRVAERLNAWELHLRRAAALLILERPDEARAEARAAFDMKPSEAARLGNAAAWAHGQGEATGAVWSELGVLGGWK